MHTQSLPPTDRDAAPEAPLAVTQASDGRQNTRINGDTVAESTRHLPDEPRSVIRKFHAYYSDHDLSLKEAGRLINYDNSTLSQIFTGRYTARLDHIVDAMKKFLDLEDKRAQGGKLEFIETDLSEKIFNALELARETQRVAFFIGDSHIGKTEAALAYTRKNNHGRTIYTRMPASGSVNEFRQELARQLRLGKYTAAQLNQAIFNAIDNRMVLIIDEMSLCIPKTDYRTKQMHCVEFIREIFDRCKCGMGLFATKIFAREMESGTFAKVFQQFKLRRLCVMQLPERPTQKDLNTFAGHFGLKPSEGAARTLEKAMIENEALGMWLTILRLGSKLAASRNQKLTWDHVISAHKGLESLEGKNN